MSNTNRSGGIVAAALLVCAPATSACYDRHDIDELPSELDEDAGDLEPDGGTAIGNDPCEDVDDTNVIAQITCDLGTGGADGLLQLLGRQQGGLGALGNVTDLLGLVSGLSSGASALSGAASALPDLGGLLDLTALLPNAGGTGEGQLDPATLVTLLSTLVALQNQSAATPALPDLGALLTGLSGTTPAGAGITQPPLLGGASATPGLPDLATLLAGTGAANNPR